MIVLGLHFGHDAAFCRGRGLSSGRYVWAKVKDVGSASNPPIRPRHRCRSNVRPGQL